MPELKGDPAGSPFCFCRNIKWVAVLFARKTLEAGGISIVRRLVWPRHCAAPRFLAALVSSSDLVLAFALCDGAEWQNLRAMHVLDASDGKRGPSWQDLHTVYSQTVVCRAFQIHGAQILPKPAHFGYIAAIYCHEGTLFPSELPFRMHQVKILPRMSARGSFGRISRLFAPEPEGGFHFSALAH